MLPQRVFVHRTEMSFYQRRRVYLKSQSGKIKMHKQNPQGGLCFVVPNPYIVTNDIEPTNRLPNKTRGERRMYFENLPMQCKIRIFTLSGELVRTLDHSSTTQSGRENWDLLNTDGFSVAYGLYFAHIDAPGIGEKLIKLHINMTY